MTNKQDMFKRGYCWLSQETALKLNESKDVITGQIPALAHLTRAQFIRLVIDAGMEAIAGGKALEASR